METHRELCREQQLIILFSRLTFTPEQTERVAELISEGIDWFLLLRYSVKNKVLPLVWHHLQSQGYRQEVPLRLGQIMNFYKLGTAERNQVYLRELSLVASAFGKNGIPCVPLKGAYLIPQMYKDRGIRTVNDMDCLIRKGDVKSVRSIMQGLGYVEGEYDKKTNTITPVNRERALLWQTNMNNLLPFLKLHDSEYAPVTQIDFSFSLDLELQKEPVEIMITGAVKDADSGFHYLNPAHFFIHQCCHHYKEASNASWVALNSDLNLIKFCDVREYILRFMNEEQLRNAVAFAKDTGLEKAVYFTLYYLKEIFDDGYEEQLLQEFEFSDTSFLYTYGQKDYGHTVAWKKGFWERLFSDTNKDELQKDAKYAAILQES
ncbi:nucleotidyltransferase family protein [Paenibacillus athensensis]|uniref:Nucleotidyltransferase family protein n=1 Tax=Paenibacillus athensensis TaxID=1967502 RepID=A0A4Y8Q936_9BACL|nr:nucleotidyltransferase family protein [Paenibacillus athensensis]MCD1258892.1 nucleotidyltransferase family protein [Paenibacillus athensensis]